MNGFKETGTVIIAALIPAGMNLTDINDFLTSLAALFSIGFTIYKAVKTKKNKTKNGDSKEEKQRD